MAEPTTAADLPRSLTIEIDPPIEWNGRTFSEMRLEEPKGKQVRRAEQELATGANFATLRAYQFALVSQCSGIPVQVIDEMWIGDIQKAADFLARFMPGGLGTGGI
jgi:hypothetical protein